jgi:4-oxalocrotonate tautomerase
MPHVIVKLWPGKSEEQKTRLAEAITRDVMEIFHYGKEAISVAMEEINPPDWAEKFINRTSLENRSSYIRNPVIRCNAKIFKNLN